jgi:RNA polymerase sigma-32 factor
MFGFGETGLHRYLSQIRNFPMLSPEEEYKLARRHKENGDRGAGDRLVTSHLRLVAKTAIGYRGYGLPVSDLISEGSVGLIEAVKRFDPEKGFRLATYAAWWIRAAIQAYVLRSWSLVRIGTNADQKRLFFNLRRVKGHIQALDEGDLRPDQVANIATKLDVSEEDVVSMNRRLGGDASLNAPRRGDGETGSEWQDWLVDDAPDPEECMAENEEADKRRRLLRKAVAALSDREQRIFQARWLADEPRSLEELSSEFGVSHQRVYQLEVRALEKVQKMVGSGA